MEKYIMQTATLKKMEWLYCYQSKFKTKKLLEIKGIIKNGNRDSPSKRYTNYKNIYT